MKKRNSVFSILMVLSLVGCTSNKPSNSSSSSSGGEVEPETILNNFFNKVEENNYSITAPVFTSYVYSEQLVHLSYDGGFDYYYMNTNKNELYYLDIEDGQSLDVHDIAFLGKGLAINNLDISMRLLNYWELYLTDNIWDTFTNDPDTPLKYTIEKEGLGAHILEYIATVSGAYKFNVENVNLILDDVNPTAATIEVTFDDPEIETINVDIKFGIERKQLIVDSWLNDENRYYAPVQQEWQDNDFTAFIMTYNQTVGNRLDEAIPFPKEFATRTFHRYGTAYGTDASFFITDTSASKEGYDAYASKLVKEYGFEKHEKIIDGSLIDRYDKKLYSYRDRYFAYSSIYLEYTVDGVNMDAKLTYNDITYLGRDTVNELIDKMHFPSLSQNDYMVNFLARDDTLAQCEAYWFITPYTQSYRLEIDHIDDSEAEKYIEAYYETLLADGFEKSQSSNFMSKDNDQYDARLDSAILDDKLYIQFWYVEYIPDAEVISWMNNYQFPAIDVTNLSSTAKDATKYYQYDSNVYQESILALDITFSSVDERNDYMTTFVLRLINEENFEEVDPRKVKVARRDTAFYNENKGLIIAYNDDQTEPIVSFHLIKVVDDFTPLP